MNAKIISCFAIALAACGSAADVENFLQAQAKAQCAWEFRCCTSSEIQTLYGAKYTTEDDCYPYEYLALQNQLYLERLAANEGRVKVDQDQASACLDQLNMQVCNPKPGQPAPVTDPNAVDPCTQVLVGATPAGAECIYASECQKGTHCVTDGTAVGRGVCVPYQNEGDICNSDTDCDPTQKGLYCAQKDFTCHMQGQLGEACAYTVDPSSGTVSLPMLLECDSAAGFYCDPDRSTCRAMPTDGQACLSPLPPGVATECDPSPALQLQCGVNNICHSPGSVGDDCTESPCKTGLYCDFTTYTCRTAPGLGQTCVQGSCATPYFCDTSTNMCVQPASFSESCASVPCGPDLFCDFSTTDTCVYTYPTGHICTTSDQCMSGNCAYDTTVSNYRCGPSLAGATCSGSGS